MIGPEKLKVRRIAESRAVIGAVEHPVSSGRPRVASVDSRAGHELSVPVIEGVKHGVVADIELSVGVIALELVAACTDLAKVRKKFFKGTGVQLAIVHDMQQAMLFGYFGPHAENYGGISLLKQVVCEQPARHELTELNVIAEPFENFFSLQLPEVSVNTDALNWHRYNPRKEIARWGASITSLEGGDAGVPDLDSLYEYNRLNGTSYQEGDFRRFTAAGKIFEFLSQDFDLGRSHFIRLGAGGYFPYHRDLGRDSFRLIYCVENCHPANFVWLQDDRVLRLHDRQWYYVNTKMPHATFAFHPCVFAVFNVINSEKSAAGLRKNLAIK